VERPRVTDTYVDRLFRSFPNPFSRATSIGFSLARASGVELAVFNVTGQVVKTLVREVRQPGYHMVRWDGRDEAEHRVSPGVYFYQMTAGQYRSVDKMLVLR
jgi:flagellar hook assembly protein FlgD